MSATGAAAVTFIGVIYLAMLNMAWVIPLARPDIRIDRLIYIYTVLTIMCAGLGAAVVQGTWGAP